MEVKKEVYLTLKLNESDAQMLKYIVGDYDSFRGENVMAFATELYDILNKVTYNKDS